MKVPLTVHVCMFEFQFHKTKLGHILHLENRICDNSHRLCMNPCLSGASKLSVPNGFLKFYYFVADKLVARNFLILVCSFGSGNLLYVPVDFLVLYQRNYTHYKMPDYSIVNPKCKQMNDHVARKISIIVMQQQNLASIKCMNTFKHVVYMAKVLRCPVALGHYFHLAV